MDGAQRNHSKSDRWANEGRILASSTWVAGIALTIWIGLSSLAAQFAAAAFPALAGSGTEVSLTALMSLGVPVNVGTAVLHPHLVAIWQPQFAALFLIPALAAFTLGICAARVRVSRPWRVLLTGSAIWATAISIMAASTHAELGGVVPVHVEPLLAVAVGLAWTAVFGASGFLCGRLLPAHLRTFGTAHGAGMARGRAVVAGLAAGVLVVTAVNPATGNPAAAAAFNDDVLGQAISGANLAQLRPAVAAAVRTGIREGSLHRAVTDPTTGMVTFAVMDSPLSGSVPAWLAENSELVAATDGAGLTLAPVETTSDPSGVHVKYAQLDHGVPVYKASVAVHLDSSQTRVLALSNGAVSGSRLASGIPSVSPRTAQRTAARAAPRGAQRMAKTVLRVLDGALVWVVWLGKPGYSSRYFVTAQGEPMVVHVESMIREGLNREVYDAANTRDLPGTLVRGEGGAPTAIADANAAYDGTGAAYSFFRDSFGRDSFDGAGRTITSTVRFGNRYVNAYWDGSQMVFGDAMATVDITAHELSHAVTDWTSELDYRDQSGALNESFSDMMATAIEARVEGGPDWTIGEGSAGGIFRSMADPTRYGQPAHLSNYSKTCSDHGGVHINSGIPNKAFYNAAMTLGLPVTSTIFYRAFTGLLTSKATFNQAREATLDMTSTIYPNDAATYNVIRAAWDAVGVDGSTEPPKPDCGCSSNAALSGAGLTALNSEGPSVAQIRSALYLFRDVAMPNSAASRHFGESYDQNSGAVAQLLKRDPKLQGDAAKLLQTMTPPLVAIAEGRGEQVRLTKSEAVQITRLGKNLRARAIAAGNRTLARTIKAEMALLKPQTLIGKTYDQAEQIVSARLGNSSGH